MKESFAFAFSRSFMDAYALRCKPLCAEMNLPQMALDVLMILGDEGMDLCTATEISQEACMKENILSVHVNRLVTQGYVRRSPVPGDRRKVHLECTEAAKPWIEKGLAIQRQFFQDIRQGLQPEELHVLRHCLVVINENACRIIREDSK